MEVLPTTRVTLTVSEISLGVNLRGFSSLYDQDSRLATGEDRC
jgi:hypothetical protein